ncbi:MAG: TIGR02587 family membrane protein [Acidimicrobiia bacterium]|nr:TIGR02587 family membrane protein [Acidimicrobiia bacterium]
MNDPAKRPRQNQGPGESVATTLRQLVRGIAGGLLLGLPPLFTMEMWFQGFLLDSWKMVVLIAITFVIVIGYSAFSGFRHERTWPDLIIDSIQTMGIAVVVSLIALFLLGRIDPDTSLRDAIGKIGVQTIPISLGISLAGAQLADPKDDGDEAADGGAEVAAVDAGPYGRFFVVLGAALFLSLNIAPTEESIFLVVGTNWWLLLLIVFATLLMSYAIVFYADFRGGRSPTAGDSPLDHPLTETAVAYALSLFVSAFLVWSFGQTEGATVHTLVSQFVLLGVVAAFGGAAGRLLIGSGTSSEST